MFYYKFEYQKEKVIEKLNLLIETIKKNIKSLTLTKKREKISFLFENDFIQKVENQSAVRINVVEPESQELKVNKVRINNLMRVL